MMAIDVYLPTPWKLNEWHHVIPIGDVHRGSPEHDEKAYLAMLDWCRTKKNYLVIGMGEYCDWFSGSEKRAFRIGEFHDGTVYAVEREVHARAMEHAELYREIAQEGRLLGLAYGHHNYVFQHPEHKAWFGKEVTQLMCEHLNVPYLGFSGLLNVCMAVTHSSVKAWRHFTIYYHHGHGAARTPGGRITPVKRKREGFDADIYLMGHDHAKWDLPETVLNTPQPTRAARGGKLRAGGLIERESRITHRKIIYGRTGSFQKTYTQGPRASYGEVAGFHPADIGVLKISLRWKAPSWATKNGGRQMVDQARLDGHASA